MVHPGNRRVSKPTEPVVDYFDQTTQSYDGLASFIGHRSVKSKQAISNMLSDTPIVAKVAEIANQLTWDKNSAENDSNTTPLPCLSTLCQLHDELIESCQGVDETRKRMQSKISQFQISPLESGSLEPDEIAAEADIYRAVLGLSLYLIQHIPSTQCNGCYIQSKLKRIIRQSTLLLNILSTIYSLANGASIDSVPTVFPVLQLWIDNLQEDWTDQTSTLISFDRKDLAMEEDQLLLMACTPTPLESNQISIIPETKELLVARMPCTALGESDSTTTVQIGINNCGLIRLIGRDDNTWWAALTASSTTHYKSPTFTIHSVVTPTKSTLDSKSSFLSGSTLALQVGRDGQKWWEATSAIIEQLKELKQLQDELQSLGIEEHDDI